MLVLAVILGGAYFAFSKYLVSRLDGTGGVSAAPSAQIETYAPNGFGLSFDYAADRYDTQLLAQDGAQVVALLPEGYQPVENGEGPPSIALWSAPIAEGVSLADWVRSDSRSNFALSSDGVLTPVVVGGEPAVAYRHSGLYETDAVALLRGGQVYVFTAGWAKDTDPIRTDFQDLLATIRFN